MTPERPTTPQTSAERLRAIRQIERETAVKKSTMTPERFHDSAVFVFGSLRRAAQRLGLAETTVKRMAGRQGRAPQPVPAEMARRLERAEAALDELFPARPPG